MTLTRLSPAAIEQGLMGIPGWILQNDQLHKSCQFKSFKEAIKFVNEVADIAEELNHHPDIHIYYNRIELYVSTHDAGGITHRDFELAQRIK